MDNRLEELNRSGDGLGDVLREFYWEGEQVGGRGEQAAEKK